MSLSQFRSDRGAEASPKRNPVAALFLVLGLLAASIGAYAVAGASTTLSPSTPGPTALGADSLVRDASLHIATTDAGYIKTRSYSATNPPYPAGESFYTAPTFSQGGIPGGISYLAFESLLTGAIGCPADAKGPYTRVEVSGPADSTESTTESYYSPLLNRNLNLLTGVVTFSKAPDANQVPFGTATSGYRGGTPANFAGPVGFDFDYNLANRDAGVYTVKTIVRNAYRQSNGVPSSSRPGHCIAGNEITVKTETFEYRPWQHVFTDIGGQGTISFNKTPISESQQRVAGQNGAIIPGHMTYYTVPGLDAFALPSDPSECATDPASCLPTGALTCDPTAGCEPRLVIISRSQPSETLQGIFDLETGAFISTNRVGSTGRIMFSLGTKLDPIYAGIIPKLRAAAAALGMDIDDLLGLGVVLAGGPGGRELKLTLLNGLQIDPSTHKAGLHLLTDIGVEAGLLLDVYTTTVAAPLPDDCSAGEASSAGGDTGFERTVGSGYRVEKSDLLIDVPAVAGLDALGVGGPIWHIEGRFTPPTIIGLHGALAGVGVNGDMFERSIGEAYEAPLLSINYLLNAASVLTAPYEIRKMDFLGTAQWAASETDAGPLGCFVVDFMLGVGVSLNNNPLPIGFGTLPIWGSNPLAAGLTAQINAAVASLLGQVTTNPTVAAILAQITGAIPPIEGVPALP